MSNICQLDGHQQKEIKGICLNKDCVSPKLVCQFCFENKIHENHLDEVLNLEQLNQKKQEGTKLVKNINETIDLIQERIQILKELANSLSGDLNLNFVDLPKDYLIICLSKLQIADSLFSQELKALDQLFQNEIKFKSLSLEQENMKYTLKNVLQQKQIVPIKPENLFKFSQQFKNDWVVVSQEGKVAQGTYICVVEPALKNSPVHGISFKIIKTGGCICVGFCELNKVKNNKFEANFTNIGHGQKYLICSCYLIRNNGETYSDHDSELNYTKQSFTFNDNDIIQVEVDVIFKIIYWTKKNSYETFNMKYVGDRDLYPCVHLYYATVEIINE